MAKKRLFFSWDLKRLWWSGLEATSSPGRFPLALEVGHPTSKAKESALGTKLGWKGIPQFWGRDRECPKDLCMLQYYFWTLQEDSDSLILKSEMVCKYVIVQIYTQKPWDQSYIGEKIITILTGTVTELNKTQKYRIYSNKRPTST